MTNKDAADMARAKLQCIINEQSGVCDEMCDECGLLYMQGNMGEHKEWLSLAIKALEKEDKPE